MNISKTNISSWCKHIKCQWNFFSYHSIYLWLSIKSIFLRSSKCAHFSVNLRHFFNLILIKFFILSFFIISIIWIHTSNITHHSRAQPSNPLLFRRHRVPFPHPLQILGDLLLLFNLLLFIIRLVRNLLLPLNLLGISHSRLSILRNLRVCFKYIN